MRGPWARRALFVVFFVGLGFAPIFPRLTLVRAQVVGQSGDVVSQRWTFDSLWGSAQGLSHARSEERAWMYLAIDVVVCASLAGFLARAIVGRRGG